MEVSARNAGSCATVFPVAFQILLSIPADVFGRNKWGRFACSRWLVGSEVRSNMRTFDLEFDLNEKFALIKSNHQCMYYHPMSLNSTSRCGAPRAMLIYLSGEREPYLITLPLRARASYSWRLTTLGEPHKLVLSTSKHSRDPEWTLFSGYKVHYNKFYFNIK
jgi:hypothetical protein